MTISYKLMLGKHADREGPADIIDLGEEYDSDTAYRIAKERNDRIANAWLSSTAMKPNWFHYVEEVGHD